MPVVELSGITIDVDEDGFIQVPDTWSEELAAAIALTEEVETLTEDHWKVINYLRGYYQQFGIAPMIRKLCKDTGFQLKYIYELFPSGPAKGACKIAGLPKPTGCV
jgi:TusE/DsrC/DsvC family sulfur relay protein